MPSTCSGLATAPTRRRLDLTNPSTIRAIARRFGIRFQRRLGQNFLASREHLERIIAALELAADDRLVEVGAGIGTLTVELARRSATVSALEIDPACIRALRLTLRGYPTVRIVEGDVLRTSIRDLIEAPYRVVGNIPYNLTGALLVHLLQQARPPGRIDLLVQQEVAERIAAPPGGWSLATLGVRVYGDPALVLRVPRSAFVPPPKVDAALVQIVPAPQPAIPRESLKAFFEFVTPFFQARRKQLPYALVHRFRLDPAEARRRLRVIGIDPARRPETLSLEEWRRLFESEQPA
jgi:16S rRNA (adenine1518-N6/adenine1519-N6)-dimethyltransferase